MKTNALLTIGLIAGSFVFATAPAGASGGSPEAPDTVPIAPGPIPTPSPSPVPSVTPTPMATP